MRKFGGTDINIIILIVLIAILCAMAGALAYWFLEGRSDSAQSSYETYVDGRTIQVDADTDKMVEIISTADPADTASTQTRTAQTIEAHNATASAQAIIMITPITATPTSTPVTPVTVPPVVTMPVIVQPIVTLPVIVQPIVTPPVAVQPLPPQTNAIIYQTYTVVPGDTLYRLTVKFNTTISLMAQYGIDSSDIVVGNVLQIPVANPAFCPGTYPYVVKEGDTLFNIARKCGTTVTALAQLNGFNANSSLYINQVICVPNPP